MICKDDKPLNGAGDEGNANKEGEIGIRDKGTFLVSFVLLTCVTHSVREGSDDESDNRRNKHNCDREYDTPLLRRWECIHICFFWFIVRSHS